MKKALLKMDKEGCIRGMGKPRKNFPIRFGKSESAINKIY